jgi:rfaE bifunctional protein nucleotidyltransferase chain/domain
MQVGRVAFGTNFQANLAAQGYYLQNGVVTELKPPRTVLCHGCFDLLHLGHIRHLQEARAMGDRLVVSVTADPHVGKGAGRPHFTLAQRVEALKALSCVDDVIVSSGNDASEVIRTLRPDVYAKGPDYNLATLSAAEVAAANEGPTRIAFTKGEKWSSSRLINAEKFDERVLAYLSAARSGGVLQRVRDAFAVADTLRIAFVGETIIDEYRFVSALGKSSKEFVIATVETGREEFVGGVVAASKHGDWPNVEVITPATHLRKTRFVDRDFNRKLFEVYDRKSLDLHPALRAKFRQQLSGIGAFDVVVVTDFGHGLLDAMERSCIEESAKFLAVNAQSNAGNWGFNPVTKWKRADYICIDEPEIKLATAVSETAVEGSGMLLVGMIKTRKMLVTRGKVGSYFYEPDAAVNRCGHAPALASSAVDTMGAGDAVIAVTAPLIAAGLDLEAAALVGNLVGAIKVGILGHRRHVGRQEIVQTVESLLK